MDIFYTGTEWLLLWSIMAVGWTLQGALGFGMALIATPLLALFAPHMVPGALLMNAFLLTFLTTHREWRTPAHGEWRPIIAEVKWALVGRIFGSWGGAAILAILPDDQLGLILAITVFTAVALSLRGWKLTPTTGTLLTAGFLSGVMGTTAAIGGPAIAIVYQYASGARLRSTLGLYFCAGSLISLLALASLGHLHGGDLLAGLFLLPGSLAGFFLSAPLMKYIDSGLARPLILMIATGAAALLLFRTLFHPV